MVITIELFKEFNYIWIKFHDGKNNAINKNKNKKRIIK